MKVFLSAGILPSMGFASSGFNIWKSYKTRHCRYACRTHILLSNSASSSCRRAVQIQNPSLGVSFSFIRFLYEFYHYIILLLF